MLNIFRLTGLSRPCLIVNQRAATFVTSLPLGFDPEVKTESFTTLHKKYFFDVKDGPVERYIKISELCKVSVVALLWFFSGGLLSNVSLTYICLWSLDTNGRLFVFALIRNFFVSLMRIMSGKVDGKKFMIIPFVKKKCFLVETL